jgi:hypothetical protein
MAVRRAGRTTGQEGQSQMLDEKPRGRRHWYWLVVVFGIAASGGILLLGRWGCRHALERIEATSGLDFPAETRLLAWSGSSSPPTFPEYSHNWAKIQFPTSQREAFLQSFPGARLIWDGSYDQPTVITSPPLDSDWWARAGPRTRRRHLVDHDSAGPPSWHHTLLDARTGHSLWN